MFFVFFLSLGRTANVVHTLTQASHLYSILTAVEVQNVQNSGSSKTFTSDKQQRRQCRLVEHEKKSEERPPPAPLCPPSVPDVTDLSGMSRAALPSPVRATAFEFLLAVMFICKPAAHLMDKHMESFTHPSPNLNLDSYRFFLHFYFRF